jgi:predicted DNA-binding transcriptional regulator AlpA
MMDRKQIAEKLGVSVDTLRRSIEPRTDFPRPALRMSQKTVRWDETEIDRWIKRQRQLAQA